MLLFAEMRLQYVTLLSLLLLHHSRGEQGLTCSYSYEVRYCVYLVCKSEGISPSSLPSPLSLHPLPLPSPLSSPLPPTTLPSLPLPSPPSPTRSCLSPLFILFQGS